MRHSRWFDKSTVTKADTYTCRIVGSHTIKSGHMPSRLPCAGFSPRPPSAARSLTGRGNGKGEGETIITFSPLAATPLNQSSAGSSPPKVEWGTGRAATITFRSADLSATGMIGGRFSERRAWWSPCPRLLRLPRGKGPKDRSVRTAAIAEPVKSALTSAIRVCHAPGTCYFYCHCF
jgi:hypothetical protein